MRFVLTFICMFMTCVSAQAHELRPAFLQISETAGAHYEISWKQPIIDGQRVEINPIFPQACKRSGEARARIKSTITERFILKCDLSDAVIRIQGLHSTQIDVFVKIQTLDGEIRQELLKPNNPHLDLSTASNATTWQYLWIGVEHIIYGWDHLLFVTGLVLLVIRRQIIGVATSFTLAHSITLALAAFGWLILPIQPIEILIAASIILLAIEILRKRRGMIGLSIKRPYLIGFLIGLIHGCGFASALSEIGLPKGTELLSLLLFNLGVELDQFFIIGLFTTLLWALAKSKLNKTQWVEISTAYITSTIAMFWFIDRVTDYFV